jgi:hypothetical protein
MSIYVQEIVEQVKGRLRVYSVNNTSLLPVLEGMPIDWTQPLRFTGGSAANTPYRDVPQVEIILLSFLLYHEIQLKSPNSNCVNCDYFTQNGSRAILGKIVIVDTIRIL